MEQVKLNKVKPGDYVRRRAGAKTTYVKGAYDRASKTFSLIDFDDINREIFLKGATLVWVGFTF